MHRITVIGVPSLGGPGQDQGTAINARAETAHQLLKVPVTPVAGFNTALQGLPQAGALEL